jgi:radical SAM superfamily enzyme YgiQ (UPF0313 family)
VDLLLSHGYFLDEDPHERAVMKPYPPLGILYLSGYLKSKGFSVEVFDNTFSRRQDFVAKVAAARPPVVGLYCTLMTRRSALGLIAECKQLGSKVIVGGPEPVNYAEEYLSRGADVVVAGEGELTVEALLPALAERGPHRLHDVGGIVFRDEDGAVVKTESRKTVENLDTLPFPDRAAIDLPHYVRVWKEHHGRGSVSLITARGCPFRCNWCSHSVYGYSHRRRSVTNVADEIDLIMETYRPEQVWYADDVFTIHKKWFFAYAEELKRRGRRIPFETISREDRLDEDIVRTLAEMGCYRLWVGAESGSQNILDRMERKTDAERMRGQIQLLKRHGIETGTFIMLGYDGETVEDLEATVDHLRSSLPDLVLTTVAYPIKGTLYHQKVSERVVSLRPWEEGSDRDLTVKGRYSRRFYQFATRWMVNEVALERARRSTAPPVERAQALARTFLSAQVGRLGMALTESEVEAGASSPTGDGSLRSLAEAASLRSLGGLGGKVLRGALRRL